MVGGASPQYVSESESLSSSSAGAEDRGRSRRRRGALPERREGGASIATPLLVCFAEEGWWWWWWWWLTAVRARGAAGSVATVTMGEEGIMELRMSARQSATSRLGAHASAGV